MVRFQLLYLDRSICKEEELLACKTVMHIKSLVKKAQGIDIHSQVISHNNVVLQDSFSLD